MISTLCHWLYTPGCDALLCTRALGRYSGHSRSVIFRAASALPYNDRARAVAGLRGQLRLMVLAGGATPDWLTMSVEGPVEVAGLHGAVWFEWTATVEARRDRS
jgi:hypothetical protein